MAKNWLNSKKLDHLLKAKLAKDVQQWRAIGVTTGGSSEHLQADVEQLGVDQFTREILYFCETKGEMSYLEAKEQFDRRVLETDEYYNGIINVRVGGSKILRQRLLEQAKQSNT